MPQLENRFTWSKSRGETFEACLRRYWWTYYGSWGGWASDAPTDARSAYLLKNLHSRWTWAGDVVHRAIEGILRRLQGSVPAGALALAPRRVDPQEEVAAVTARMRSQFRDSRDHRYRNDPKRIVGLVEHEYDLPIPDSEWKEIHRRAVEGLSAFLASPVFARIRATDPSTWLPFEELDSFDFEGVPVWAALDFAMRTEGGAEVFDWKTGESRPEENRLQLLCYALYVQARHGVPAERVTCHLVYVNSGQVIDFTPTTAELDVAKGAIRSSIGRMRALLVDGAGNAGLKDRFPMTDELERCEVCCFRRLCNR